MKALRIAIAAATGAARNESFPPYKSSSLPPPLRLLAGEANSSRVGFSPAKDLRLFTVHMTLLLASEQLSGKRANQFG